MSTNEHEEPFTYSFETPIDDNITAYTEDRRKLPTQRRVSFDKGDTNTIESTTSRNHPDSKGGPSPVTPQKSHNVEVDSPYTETNVTPEMVRKLLDETKRRPRFDQQICGSVQACDFDMIPLLICGLLQLNLLAHTLSTWNKGNSSIPHLIESLTEKRPLIIETILQVTHHTGAKARSLITQASHLLEGQESDTHTSVVMCIMMYVWATHPESKKKAIALLAIQDYVLADDNDVAALLKASEKGTSIDLHASWFADDLRNLPGCKRLDHAKNFANFTANWEHAFALMANRLTYEVPSKTNMGCLESSLAQFAITLENRDTHPLVTVSEKHAALIAMQRTLVQQCKAAGLESRAPTESICSDQLMLSVCDKTFTIFKSIVCERALWTASDL